MLKRRDDAADDGGIALFGRGDRGDCVIEAMLLMFDVCVRRSLLGGWVGLLASNIYGNEAFCISRPHPRLWSPARTCHTAHLPLCSAFARQYNNSSTVYGQNTVQQ